MSNENNPSPTTPESVSSIAELMRDDAIKLITAEVAAASEASYKAISSRLVDDLCAQISNRVQTQLRGEKLFGNERGSPMPTIAGVVYLADEQAIMEFKKGPYCIKISNYGRMCHTYGTPTQIAPLGRKLTDEVIEYIRSCVHDSTGASIDGIIKKYNEKWAFAHNEVHENKIKEIRAALRKEFDEEAAVLNARSAELSNTAAKLSSITDDTYVQIRLNQAEATLLARERAEFDAAVAEDAAHRKSEQEVAASKKQLSDMRRLMTREVARMDTRAAALRAESDRLEKLRKQLDEREELLGATVWADSEESD